jgi:glycosyltransferase involved in cell wall biosynthesis
VREALRIVHVNLAYDPAAASPGALLDNYHTLTGWSSAVARAGAAVSVVQRFSSAATLTLDGLSYEFCADDGPPVPPPSFISAPVLDAIRANDADIVHLNGLMFPAMVGAIRQALPQTVIVVQDHAGRTAPSRFERLRESSWHALNEADAWSFTAVEHAAPWREAGLLGKAEVLQIVESSTTIEPMPLGDARAVTGIQGEPVILWVGRLNANKDPLTVLNGLERAFHNLSDARCWMAYGEAPLEAAVRDGIGRTAVLRDRVTLVGEVPHSQMARYYSAADIYVSGSHREGSGYALIEAMACGAVPVVTDIPSFRAIAGDCGERWIPGNAGSCAEALLKVAALDREAARRRVRERFERALSWGAIGRLTVEAYERLHDERRRRAPS